MANREIRFNDKRHTYNREYNRIYRLYKHRNSQIGGKHKTTPLTISASLFQFTGTDEDEPIVCSHFGCSKHLTHEERLYGTLCISHQSKTKPDPTLRISLPIKKVS